MKKGIRLIIVLMAAVILSVMAVSVSGFAYEMNMTAQDGTPITLNSIDEVTLTLKAPVAGSVSTKTPAEKSVTVPSGSLYSLEQAGWCQEDGDPCNADELKEYIFQEGKTYQLWMLLKADKGYFFSSQANISVSGGKLVKLFATIEEAESAENVYAAAMIIASVTIEKSKPETCTISFDANGGSGTMKEVVVNKGDAYTLPKCEFTAPSGKEFDKWDKGSPDAEITVNENMTIKALWKDKPASQPEQPQQPDQPEQPQQPEPPDQPQQPDQPQEEQVRERITLKKKVKSVKAKALSKNKIKVTWKKLSSKYRKKAKMIEIQVSTDKDFTNIVKTKVLKSSKTSYTASGLTKNTRYYIRIRVYNTHYETIDTIIKEVSPWVTKHAKTKR